MVTTAPMRIPAGPGRGEERQPTVDELALIQWTFGITGEAGYGPQTQAGVQQVQEAAGIPVDSAVLIGPRTWWFLTQAYLERYRAEAAAAAEAAPALLPGPASAEERVPTAEECRLIQWLFNLPAEDGYGPDTRAAVARLQEEHGIPVDPAVMIGPRTWQALEEVYRQKAASVPTVAWEIPDAPYQLTGTSEAEQNLAKYVRRLNDELIPEAAQLYVRNRKICQLKAEGTPPGGRIDLPPLSDPEVQQCIAQLAWDQGKVDRLWVKARESRIDPRMMFAVLCQEGTGSFDTNAEIPVQFWDDGGYWQGGSGVQPDFEADLAAAMEEHILAKIRAYGWYGPLFRSVAEEAGLGDGNVFQYVNYNVPWVKGAAWEATPGCYATHTEWWAGLKSYFDELVHPDATHEYSRYLEQHPLPVDTAPVPVRFIVTDRGTGWNETITHQPWIEADPL